MVFEPRGNSAELKANFGGDFKNIGGKFGGEFGGKFGGEFGGEFGGKFGGEFGGKFGGNVRLVFHSAYAL